MRISDEQRAEITKEAEAAGLDPAEVIAEAEGMPEPEQKPAAKDEKPGADDEKKPAAEVKIFGYHLPFMRVNEVREQIGLPPDMVDGELPTGEWLLLHGGGPSAAPPATEPTGVTGGNDGA